MSLLQLTCVAGLLSLIASAANAAGAPQVEKEIPGADPLVPFSEYLKSSSFESPQISPDGKHIVFLAPVGGVANLMLAPSDEPTKAVPLTHDTGRGFQSRTIWGERSVRWAEDSRHLLYMRDDKGDENWVLYALDTTTGATRQLTPASGVRVRGVQTSDKFPGRVLFSMNDRNPKVPDYYVVDITTGERKHAASAAPYQAKLFDSDFTERVAFRLEADQSWTFERRADDGKWVQFVHMSREDASMMLANFLNDSVSSIFAPDGSKLIAFSSQDLDTNALVQYDMKTGKREVIAVEKGVDIKRAIVHPTTAVPQAYVRYWTHSEWKVLDPALQADFDFLAKGDDGQLEIESRSRDDRKWLVSFMHSDRPTRYFLYDRARRKTDLVGVSTPQLAGMKLSKMIPLVTRSSDGFDLVSYVSFPAWVKLDEHGVPDKPLPTITYVHGGPSDERPMLAFAPMVQWLTNRGYIFFYVNFRGSPGFGKAFMNAQKHEWGGAMNRDVVEQVHTIVERGIADRKRVAILGGSYGGYATLVAMTKTPDVFACGIDVVGPSNLETFIDPATMPPDWNAENWYALLGDPRTEAGRKLLRDRSPINFAAQTRGSMLIVQGANDVRVPTRESQAVVDKMAQHDVKVTYLLYPDEGHGLLRKQNNASFNAITEVFLGQCLGGRYQPIDSALEGSSVQVPTGVEHIPGLKQALAARVSDGLMKVDPSIDASTFGDFVGAYDLGGYEVGVAFEAEQLFITIPGQGKHRMLPFEKDGFFLSDAPVKLRFQRDAQGAIASMNVDSGGTQSTAKRKAK